MELRCGGVVMQPFMIATIFHGKMPLCPKLDFFGLLPRDVRANICAPQRTLYVKQVFILVIDYIEISIHLKNIKPKLGF